MAFPDIATDLLEVMGQPGDPESPLTLVSVTQTNSDTGATVATAENVTALKRKSLKAVFGAGDGEASAQTSSFRLWADGLDFTPKSRDVITDADAVAWNVGDVSVEGFGSFYICDPCVKVRT
jgi:hypothetical protein